MKKALYISLIGVFAALSIVLVMLIHLPLIPSVAFLEYDPADVPIYLITAVLGPVAGLIMTAVVAVVQGITVSASSGWIGIVMHFLATGFFVLAEGIVLKLMNRRSVSKMTAMAAAVGAGFVASVAVMTLWNLLFTPMYMHITMDQLLPLLPYIILFNMLKSGINGFAAFILYGSLQKPIAYITRRL